MSTKPYFSLHVLLYFVSELSKEQGVLASQVSNFLSNLSYLQKLSSGKLYWVYWIRNYKLLLNWSELWIELVMRLARGKYSVPSVCENWDVTNFTDIVRWIIVGWLFIQ